MEQAHNAVRGFLGARCFRGPEIGLARPRVSIENEERGWLPGEMLDKWNQEGVLEHVREIAGVEGMPIVHLPPVERTG